MSRMAIVSILALACIGCTSQLNAQHEQKPEMSVDDAIHNLSLQRDHAKMYVHMARAIKDDAIRRKAWMLYSEAQAQYNDFIDDIVTGIQEGGKNEKKGLAHANDAYEAGKAFKDYVDAHLADQSNQSQPTQTHMGSGISALLPPYAQIAMTILTLIHHPPGSDPEKQNRIDRVQSYKWQEWHDMNSDLSPDVPAPIVPKQPTATSAHPGS